MTLRVLIACERSGAVRRAFRALGHDAWSNDLVPADDGSQYHITGDALEAVRHPGGWDLMIGFPPCTYLSSSGLHWNKRRPERALLTENALLFVADLMCVNIPYVAIENPRGCIGTRLHPEQWGYRRSSIQPYQFGHDASKTTDLWLRRLPALQSTEHVAPRMVDGRPRWSNQTDSGQNRLTPSPTRWMERSRTYPGIAAAMADQWSRYINTDRRS